MKDIKVDFGERSYNIYIERGILHYAAERIGRAFNPTSVCIVTDTHLSNLYLSSLKADFDRLQIPVCSFVFESGEASKNLAVVEQLCAFLIKQKFDRNGMLIALGGGVVGDLTGFAASIFKRGIGYIQIPTSVVAQTDSAIGGKTGVDFGGAKNMLGAIYQPKAVYIDPDVLKTLPKHFLCDGLGEVVKYALLSGGELYDCIMNLQSPEDFLEDDGYIIAACVQYKKNLVESDERDNGSRMLLNLGHTVGHAIESYYGYGRYSHGEGVSMGLVEIMKYAGQIGIFDVGIFRNVCNLLERLQLPVELPERNPAIFSSIVQDKKCAGSTIRVVLPYAPGDVRIMAVDTDTFIKYLIRDGEGKGE